MHTKRNFLALITISGLLLSSQTSAMMRRSDAMAERELRVLVAFAVPALQVAGTFIASQIENPEAERGVYLTCNENNQEQTFETMRTLPARGNVGIGTSSLFNLSLFIARHAQGINDWILIDPAPEVQRFWQTFKDIFGRAATLDEVFSTLEEAMLARPSDYFTDMFLNRREVGDKLSYAEWLAGKLARAKNKAQIAQGKMPFHDLKKLITQHIILVPTDLTSNVQVRALQDFLSARNAFVDTLYVSSVNMALSEDELGVFRSCIAALRWQGSGPKAAYLIEAGPKSFGEHARQVATETYQRIYKDWQVE